MSSHLQHVRDVQFGGGGGQKGAHVNGEDARGGHVHGAHVGGGDPQQQAHAREIVAATQVIVDIQGG